VYWKGSDPSERLYPFHGPNFIFILSPFNLIPCLLFTQYSFVHLYLSLRGYIYMLAEFQVGFWSKLEAIHLDRKTDLLYLIYREGKVMSTGFEGFQSKLMEYFDFANAKDMEMLTPGVITNTNVDLIWLKTLLIQIETFFGTL